jgi:hypothetical protein
MVNPFLLVLLKEKSVLQSSIKEVEYPPFIVPFAANIPLLARLIQIS